MGYRRWDIGYGRWGRLGLVAALLMFLLVPLMFAVPSAAYHDVLPESHPLYEVCKTHHGTNAPSACIDAAQDDDAEGRIFGPDGVITMAARIITTITAIAAVIAIIVGGIMYVLSGGNPEQIKKARDTIIYALVGLVVAAFGQAIILFVLSRI